MKRCAIIGAGISGLTAAHWLNKNAPQLSVDVYDAAPKPGGLLKTELVEDCILDAGPDSFLTSKQAAWDLIDELSLRQEVIGSEDSKRVTYIFHDGKLRRLPEGFFLMVPARFSPFLSTDLLSWDGKLQALNDLFASPAEEDLPAGLFLEERFGREIRDRIAEPLLAGIYGADIDRLSLRSALPVIWEMQKRGSLILQSRKQNHGQLPGALFSTFRGGMQTLAQALYDRCDSIRWKLGKKVDTVGKDSNGLWQIHEEQYDALILAASTLPAIQSMYGGSITSALGSIPRNPAIVIAICFAGIHRDGFGWLVPENERRSVLACTYVSNKFKGRTPADRFLVRLFIGRSQASEYMQRTDAEICDEALSELKRIAGIAGPPIFSRVYRWQNAMPEYGVGHAAKMEGIEEQAKLEKNLFLTGNLFQGVGIPDCIAHARTAASNVAAQLGVSETDDI